MKLNKLQLTGAILGLTLLAGCTSAPSMQDNSMQTASQAERLGTKWGDEVDSRVTSVDLRRTSSNPLEQMQLYYANKSYNGRALNSVSLLAGKIDFSITADNSRRLPLYRDNGTYYLQAQDGQAYRLVYQNNSNQTYEIVASVDGLNVIDGRAASRSGNGYVLRPNGNLVIEGFRKSQSAVASFIFSQPDSAYAANSKAGSIRNTGVIGTAVYELYDPTRARPLQPQAFPADNRYAKPPQ